LEIKGWVLPLYLLTVSGELPLKSPRTRSRMYSMLISNLRRLLERRNIHVSTVRVTDAKILVETREDALEELRRVFGILRVAEVEEISFNSLEELAKEVSSRMAEAVRNKKFAVRVKRSGVHSFTSLDVAREIGALLKPYSAGVDLENPDVEVVVEVRGGKAYLHRRTLAGPGGLPLGSGGRALVLFSGGFDSPVAAWMIAKRGVEVDFIHYLMGSSDVSRQAYTVARRLSEEWLSSYSPKFILVDFTPLIGEIERKIEWSYRQVVLRALMYMVADRIASRLGYDALVTGEALAQASSQTLLNLKAIEGALSLENIILRPLIGFDKEEIVEYSRRIGLYEYSSKVAEACAIAPRHVATRTSSDKLRHLLMNIDTGLIDKVVDSMRIINVLESTPEEAIPGFNEEVEDIPPGSIVIDVRSYEKYKEESIPNAVHVSMVDLERLPSDKPVVFYCDTGGLSLVIARELRSKGLNAYSLKGGLLGYKARLSGRS